MFDLDRLEEFDRCLQDLAPQTASMSRPKAQPKPVAPQQCPYQQKAMQTA